MEKDLFVNVEQGLGCSKIEAGWLSARWELEKITGINSQNAHSRISGIGENISIGNVNFHFLENAVLEASGENEKQNFHTTIRKCKPNKICCHHTQVVWRNTTEVVFAVGIDENGQYILVCNYSPQGNFNNEPAF